MVALIPLVAQPFLTISVEAFDNIEVGAAVGSLVGVLALVAVPVLVLGAVAPWAIRLRVTSIEDAGKTAGRLYALSTLGSLFGTFAASLLLIPLIGTQRTFIFFALLLAVTAASALPLRFALVPLGIAAMLALPPGVTKDLGARTAASWSSARPSTSTRAWSSCPDGERRLELNEGQAFHSVYRPDSVLTGNVWDGYISLPFAVLGRAAALGGDPRQRRRHDRPRLRALLPRDRDRRRRDRSGADRARAASGSGCATGPGCG